MQLYQWSDKIIKTFTRRNWKVKDGTVNKESDHDRHTQGCGTFDNMDDFFFASTFLADRFAICLFCCNSIKCETSSVKRDFPLSEVLLPITIMDLIGNWKFKYSHASHLAPYMVVT